MSWPDAIVSVAGLIFIATMVLAMAWITNKREERERNR